MNRRMVLKALAAAAGTILLPIGRSGWAAAMPQEVAPGRRLIVLMLRGAVDGLNVVVPYAENAYYQARSSIAIARPGNEGGVLDLDGHFGLHPSLTALLPYWKNGTLAFVQASGSPNPSRSHFEAQDFMESGTPGISNTPDGWMNRLLGAMSGAHPEIKGISLGDTLPRIMSGPNQVATVSLGQHARQPKPMDRDQVATVFDQMYASKSSLQQAYQSGRKERAEILSDLSDDSMSAESMDENKVADAGAPSPKGFQIEAAQLAQIMRRDPKVSVAFLALGGWDTHVRQGNATGQLAGHLQPLGKGLSILAQQLGPLYSETVIVVMSEFGRTVHENGNGGTDHGHGNVMWLLGGNVGGGKVHGEWPGIEAAALYQNRDLAVTSDFRSVLMKVAERHLRLSDQQLAQVFSETSLGSSGKLNDLFRA